MAKEKYELEEAVIVAAAEGYMLAKGSGVEDIDEIDAVKAALASMRARRVNLHILTSLEYDQDYIQRLGRAVAEHLDILLRVD